MKAQGTLPPPADVIIFISRQAIRNVVRDELKALGASSFHLADTVQRCVSYLQQFPDAFLVLDWEVGQVEVTKILQSSSNPSRLSFRQILLIASDMATQVVGTAAEYNVSRVHTGEVSRIKIKEHLRALLQEREEFEPIREALFKVAQARMSRELRQASEILATLHEEHPDNNRITAEYAENLMLEDRWQEAGEIVKSLSDVEPAYTRGLHLYGRFLMHGRQYTEACEVFKRAKLLNPYNIERLLSLGQALLQVDKISEARDVFESVLKLQRGRREAVVGVGECLLMEGDVNDALKMLREVSSPRELASIFNSAAVLSMRQGRFEVGKTLYHVAMRTVDNQPLLLARLVFNLGIGYHRWQKPYDALECFEKAVDLDSSYLDARFNAEVLARKLGQQAQLPPGGSAHLSEPRAFKGDFDEDFAEETIRQPLPTSKKKAG